MKLLKTKNIIPIFLISCCLALSACSVKNSVTDAFRSEKVNPWDRDILADESMQLTSDIIESYTDEHIYFSKEAAMGGKGVGGGGCGCN